MGELGVQIAINPGPGRRQRGVRLEDHLLSLLIWVPIIGGFAVLALGNERARAARWGSLLAALVTAALCVPLYQRFSDTTAAMQFVENAAWIPTVQAQFHVGIDGISLPLIVLTGLLGQESLFVLRLLFAAIEFLLQFLQGGVVALQPMRLFAQRMVQRVQFQAAQTEFLLQGGRGLHVLFDAGGHPLLAGALYFELLLQRLQLVALALELIAQGCQTGLLR